MSKYKQFRAEDLNKSQILSQNLNISEEEYSKIESWFSELLENHQELNHHNMNRQNHIDKSQYFAQKYQDLKPYLSSSALKYWTTKAIYYYNIFWGGSLKSVCLAGIFTQMLKSIIIENIENLIITPQDFVSISGYFRTNFHISPNGNVLENLFQIERKNKISKKWQSAERQNILNNMLCIIHQKNYHHDIVMFKKILSLIQEEDADLQKIARNFAPEYPQGNYKIINEIFVMPFSDNDWEDFTRTIEIIQLLDTARGASPKDTWLKKHQILAEKIGKNTLQEVAKLVFSMKKYEYDKWKDEVVTRFLKASQWILAEN